MVRCFYLSLKWQEETNYKCQIFFPSLYKINARLDEAQAGIKIAGTNINNLRYADDTTLIAESEDNYRALHESERGECKIWLKTQHSENKDHGIRSHHFKANRWGNNGHSERLYFLGLQNHCRW